jgi:hypothetical protein
MNKDGVSDRARGQGPGARGQGPMVHPIPQHSRWFFLTVLLPIAWPIDYIYRL